MLHKLGILIIFTTVITSCSTSTPYFHEKTLIPPKRLVLCLDGVGYNSFKEIYDGGYFKGFYPPVPMVATFPSISNPNWARLFRTELEKSFTHAHFDPNVKTYTGKGKVVGNLLDHLNKSLIYEKMFDFKPEGFFQHFVNLTYIKTSALYWLDSIERDLFKSFNKENYYAFIVNTDFIAHLYGKEATFEYLAEVDKRLQKIQKLYKKKYGSQLEIVILSDHGNHFYEKIGHIDHNATLEKYGWSPGKTLSTKKDYVFAAPELISFGAFYCFQESKNKLAIDLSNDIGIDFTLVQNTPNIIDIYARGAKDHIRVTIDPLAKTVKYEVLKGQDIFGHRNVFNGKTIGWDEYFYKTYNDDYPYAAVRAWDSFNVNAKEHAPVLASAKPAMVFTNLTLKILSLGKLKSAHGSMYGPESRGVVISTTPLRDPAIRPDDFGNNIPISDFGKPMTRTD